MTLRIMILSIMTLRVMTLSIMTLSENPLKNFSSYLKVYKQYKVT